MPMYGEMVLFCTKVMNNTLLLWFFAMHLNILVCVSFLSMLFHSFRLDFRWNTWFSCSKIDNDDGFFLLHFYDSPKPWHFGGINRQFLLLLFFLFFVKFDVSFLSDGFGCHMILLGVSCLLKVLFKEIHVS